ncbi:hypothetical protein EVAR_81746_1 [Eumeta japonica]|uniref:Secreted protein n=1 Tax=Eumeta variegata TaxID=151549 RepID=A0A4C1UHH7_EUMVA|nr:hypothetical protein EVAR_81746_1 [Eumeta japonica]
MMIMVTITVMMLMVIIELVTMSGTKSLARSPMLALNDGVTRNRHGASVGPVDHVETKWTRPKALRVKNCALIAALGRRPTLASPDLSQL